jgi:hypothetical protein
MSSYEDILFLDKKDLNSIHDNVNMEVFRAILDSDFSEDKGIISQIEQCCDDRQKGWLIHRLPRKTNCNYLYKKIAESIQDEEVHYALILLTKGFLPRLTYSISQIKSLRFIERLMYKRDVYSSKLSGSFEFKDLDPYRRYFEDNKEIGKFDYSFSSGYSDHPVVVQLAYLWRLFASVDTFEKVRHLKRFILTRLSDLDIGENTYERDFLNEEDKLLLYTLDQRADLISKSVDFLKSKD